MTSANKLILTTVCAVLALTAACDVPVLDKKEKPPLTNPDAANAYDANVRGEVEVRQNIQFADIPIPQGFKLRRNLTTTFQGSSIRFGNMVYDGLWNVRETSEWFLEEMPKSGWKFQASNFQGDYNVVHSFKKGEEKAIVHIHRPNNNLRVQIQINDPPRK